MNRNVEQCPRQARVLLVDDSIADQLTMKRAAEDGHVQCQLFTVENGAQALSFLRNEAPYGDKNRHPRPDLVLMDINMPVMDGITALRHIRNDNRLCKIPVVMLTTSDASNDVDASYSDGANAFVTKPVQNRDLIGALQKLDGFWFQLVTLPGAAQ